MSNIRGSRRRRVEQVLHASRYVSQAIADCGHLVVRMGHLAVGQVVYCSECISRSARNDP